MGVNPLTRAALLAVAAACLAATTAFAAEAPQSASTARKPEAAATSSPDQGVLFWPEAVSTDGTVNVEGQRIDYRAVAGTIVVHPKGWDDAAAKEKAAAADKTSDVKDLGDQDNPQAEA